MPRQINDSNHADAAQLRDNDVDIDLAELFAVPPQSVDELSADPFVGMRIGILITAAMKKRRMNKLAKR
jgi:hypothetical protein